MKTERIFSPANILFTLCLLWLNTALATPLPESFSVKYALHKGPLELAQMTRRLYKNDAGNYVFESFSETVGIARWFTDSTLLEKTEWNYHNGQLRPTHYTYDHKSSRKNRHVKLNFDWNKMRVVNDINKDPWSMKIIDGTLDKLLYQLAVMTDLSAGKEVLEYQIADGGNLKNYSFKNLGEEQIETKMGTMKTIKLERTGKRVTAIWCAIDLNYLPVQLEQEIDDNVLTLKLQSVTGLPYTPVKNPD